MRLTQWVGRTVVAAVAAAAVAVEPRIAETERDSLGFVVVVAAAAAIEVEGMES